MNIASLTSTLAIGAVAGACVGAAAATTVIAFALRVMHRTRPEPAPRPDYPTERAYTIRPDGIPAIYRRPVPDTEAEAFLASLPAIPTHPYAKGGIVRPTGTEL